jgi:CubicO group peptidase (beta-lactamase class C family)
MSARFLILALAFAAAPIAAQDDPVALTAARIKAFPAAQSVERVDAYAPAETVKGRPRALPVAKGTGGIDPAALASAQAYADQQKTFALIVMRDGKVAYERYAPGYGPANRFSPASMAKTVTALAFGTANIPLDARVDRWLSEWKGDPRGAITVRQLLTMSSGLEMLPFSLDPAGKVMQLQFGPDVTRTALSFKAVAPPGSAFQYGNINTQLAGLVLERVTGQRFGTLLSRRIWQPIGADDAMLWLDRDGGTPRLWCCLQATARDYGRIGQLILDKGRTGGRQVVPATWIKAMATPSATNPNYGLQLWIGSPFVAERKYNALSPLVARASKPYARDDVLLMDGAVGQRVYVVPSERLVIVRIGESAMGWDDSELPNRVLAGIAKK